MYRMHLYKSCLTLILTLIILAVFSLINLEKGSAPYYLSLFSLLVDTPFLIFLLYKIRTDYKEFSQEKSKERS